MSYFDEENDDSTFRDVPDEVEGAEAAPVNVRSAPTQRPQPTQQAAPVKQEAPEQYEEGPEDGYEEEDEETTASVLSDARLRIEQGKLYEMLMNHNVFEGVEADDKAVKNVQREIRKFAQERMELMLGMRQTVSAAPDAPQAMSIEAFPFNALEVEVLKSLAAAATKGESRQADAFVPEEQPAPRKTLNPIQRQGQSKPAPRPLNKTSQAQPKKPLQKAPVQPVRRQKIDEKIQRILQEEGVTLEELNAVFPPDYKPLDPTFTENLTPEQIAERNLQGARRTMKQVPSPQAIPMPSQEMINSIHESRAATAAAHPQMQSIMTLLNQRK